MTLGEKIRYFRTKQGLTQGQLAEISGVHPVSIRKYETSKVQPQPTQVEKIATALNVSYSALHGVSNNGLRLETVGDLMGVLMVMYDANVIQIRGERGSDSYLKRDTVTIKFNTAFSNFLDLMTGENHTSMEHVLIYVKDTQIFDDLLNWEKINYTYTMSVLAAQDSDLPMLEDLLSYKNAIELEMQCSITPLEL